MEYTTKLTAHPQWMTTVLRWAGIYNMIWGTWVVLFPQMFFAWIDLPPINYPAVWQSVGMIVGVYGLGYYLASYNPYRDWIIVLVGFLGKVFGPIGFLGYAWMGWLPWHFGWVNVTNDLIWLVPFALILYGAFRHHQNTGSPARQTLSDALQHFTNQHGTTLSALSHQKPVFLVFLRHFGCTFCREAVVDLRKQQTALAAQGVQLAFAHMGTEAQAKAFFKAYEMDAYPRFSDPACELYEAFDLQRATFSQAFGWQAWWRGLQVGLWQGKGVGLPVGDGFRMPGIFVIDKGVVVKQYRHRHVAERPDYQDFCTLDTPAPALTVIATKEL